MPSLKAYIVSWYIWFNFKGSWQTTQGLRNRIQHERKNKRDYHPPERLEKEHIIERVNFAGCPVFAVSPKSETPVEARIMYLHGGGFVFEITPEHWFFVARLARRLNATVTVPIYPLGPETQLLKMYEVLQPLYNDMAAAQEDTPFWVMGDSAGATMSFVMTMQALKDGVPAATRMVPITPCMDSTIPTPESREIAKRDPWLDVEGVLEIPRLICPDEDEKDFRINPIHGDFSNLPPMLVLGASEDLLMPDARTAVGKAKEQGREAEFLLGEGMMHVWPLVPIWEAKLATDKIIEFLEAGKGK